MGGFDPLSPMIYTYSRDKEGNIEGVQSETLLGSACSDVLFMPNTPGMWFTSQGEEVRVAPFPRAPPTSLFGRVRYATPPPTPTSKPPGEHPTATYPFAVPKRAGAQAPWGERW